MKPSYFIPIFLVLFIVLITTKARNQMMIKKLIEKKKNSEDREKMTELAKKFIGKDCLIYTFSGNQLTGIIKEVSDSALLVDNGGAVEAINIDFVVRIREYPRKKNGKKKTVILD